MKNYGLTGCLIALIAGGVATTAHGQGTAFTYQSRLLQSGAPANGLYDFRFRAATDPVGNNYVGNTVLTNGIVVNDGLFTVTLDLGNIFNGTNLFLEVSERTNGALNYTTLAPLQPLTPTPYAISAENLIGAIPSGQLAGLYSNSVNFSNPGNTFAGNGTALTNVNAVSVGGIAASNFWQLGGNSVASGQFIGTVNNQALEMRVNSMRALRLEATANDTAHSNIINVIGGSPLNSVANGVYGATIAGGGALTYFTSTNLTNSVTGGFGTVSGGYNNSSGPAGAIGGG